MATGKAHWEDVYTRKAPDAVSWFTPSLTTSLSLIHAIGLPKTARIIDVGGGAATLADDLLRDGFPHVTVLDISAQALQTAQARLGPRASQVTWIAADITAVDLGLGTYDLWHDRAVFHFLTDPAARHAYVATAMRALAPGGHIIVATFGKAGPEQCSGLPVVRYDPDGLHAEFGSPFEKVRSVAESHHTPWGTEQEFVYCYCRRLDADTR